MGNALASKLRSFSFPHETRMHLFSGAIPGIRIKMPCSSNPSTIARAYAPSCPQSIATKLVADGIGFKPLALAIS